MMKKWGLLLTFTSILMGSSNCFGVPSGSQKPCCWRSQIHQSRRCCEDGAWGNEERFQWRTVGDDGACCSEINVTEAYTAHSSGDYVRGSVITQTCCESQNKKGKDPGNYKFWPTKGSQSTEDAPGKGGVCCIQDSWKSWSTGSNNGSCCRAQGGGEHDNHCCFEAYDLDAKGHSKECCKAAKGKWENGECCAKDGKGTAMANEMKQEIKEDGTVTVKMSGAKVTSACCLADGGKEYNSAFNGGDAELGCCFNGDPYGVSYTSNNNLVEECCKKPKKVTDLGDLDACCEEGEEGYIATTTGEGGEEEKAGACCKGEVFIKKFVEPRDGNYGNMDCCPIGEYVIDGACCKNKTDVAYPKGDFYDCCASSAIYDADSDKKDCCNIENGFEVYSSGGKKGCCNKDNLYHPEGASPVCCKDKEVGYPKKDFTGGCCPDDDKHAVIGMSCCTQSSAIDLDGNLSSGCCQNAGGTFVGSGSDAADGFCCVGSMDIVSGARKKECCEDGSGKWMGTFCCASWGKKVNGACEAESLPDSGSDDQG